MTPLETSIGDWLTAVLPAGYSGRIVRSDSRPVRLPAPWATFGILGDEQVAITASVRTTSTASGPDFVRVIESTMRATLSVSAFGPDAYADLSFAVAKYQDPAIVQGYDLRVYAAGPIRRLYEPVGTDRQQQAQVDFQIQYVNTIQSTIGAVESTRGTGLGITTE